METSPDKLGDGEAPEDPKAAELMSPRERWRSIKDSMNLIGVSEVGLFVIALGFTLHKMKPVLLPLVMAIMVSLVLQPVYWFFRRLKLPRVLASATTVGGLVALMVVVGMQLAGPTIELKRTVNYETMSTRLQEIFRPMKQVRANLQEVAEKVQEATEAEPTPESEKDSEGDEGEAENGENAPEGGNGVSPAGNLVKAPEENKKSDSVKDKPTQEDPESTVEASGEVKVEPKVEPVMVEMRSDPIADVMAEAKDFGVKTAAFLLMVLFTLAYGDRIMKCLNEDLATETILRKMGDDVSRYLFTITAINCTLGLCIGLAMWALGMPNPVLWGIFGMVLNYIPYVGALIGTAVVFLVAAATFDSPGPVLMVPVVYFGLTAMEGNLVTPLLLGHRFLLNPLVVFVWIFAWAAFWGITGMLIAMPSLVIFKIVCENTATMERFRKLITA